MKIIIGPQGRYEERPNCLPRYESGGPGKPPICHEKVINCPCSNRNKMTEAGIKEEKVY